MLLIFLLNLAIALIAIFISLNTTEEIVQLAAVIVTIICLFFTIVFSPIAIKLLGIGGLLLSQYFLPKVRIKRQF